MNPSKLIGKPVLVKHLAGVTLNGVCVGYSKSEGPTLDPETNRVEMSRFIRLQVRDEHTGRDKWTDWFTSRGQPGSVDKALLVDGEQLVSQADDYVYGLRLIEFNKPGCARVEIRVEEPVHWSVRDPLLTAKAAGKPVWMPVKTRLAARAAIHGFPVRLAGGAP